MSTTIIRTQRRAQFVLLSQRAVEDSRLSWAARGLLAYLLSRPDNWQVRVAHLRKQAPSGRDVVYKLLGELGSYRYLVRQRLRDEEGKLCGTVYYVYDHPKEPLPEKPYTDLPYTVFQEALTSTENNLLLNTTTTTTTTKRSNRIRTDGNSNLSLPDSLSTQEKRYTLEAVSEFPLELAQQLIDELDGIIRCGKVRETPLDCLRGIVANARIGSFTPNRGIAIADDRRRRRQTEEAILRAKNNIPEPISNLKSDPIIERISKLAERARSRNDKLK
jgi:hypothetical protein